MPKDIRNDEAARKSIQAGIDKVANAVKVTLGPRGHNVVLDRVEGFPIITNDGVTIAKEIDLKDPFENMGAQLLKEVALKTNDIAGDGTTTATVLAQSIYKQGLKYTVAGAHPMEIKRGIEAAVVAVVNHMKAASKSVSDKSEIIQVATISANNDFEIGELIADAVDKVGNAGVVTVDESNTPEMGLDITEGMQFDKGYVSPHMVNDLSRMEASYDNPYILLCDKKINDIKELVPVIEKSVEDKRALLIVAEDFSDEVLSLLVVNKLNGAFHSVAVKAPGFGDRRKDILDDIAVLVAGSVVSDDKAMNLLAHGVPSLGRATKVKVTAGNTVIFGGVGSIEDVNKRVDLIKSEIENVVSDNFGDKFTIEKLKERLARISGGVAIIKVGAPTETELKEKQFRIEDALSATRAAIEEGIIKGGGVALVESIVAVKSVVDNLAGDKAIGAKIVMNALSSPMLQIVVNAGGKGDVIVDKIIDGDFQGYDASRLEFCNMFDRGIIDPLKVTRIALQNAASIAAMLLTTEVLITEDKSCVVGEDLEA